MTHLPLQFSYILPRPYFGPMHQKRLDSCHGNSVGCSAADPHAGIPTAEAAAQLRVMQDQPDVTKPEPRSGNNVQNAVDQRFAQFTGLRLRQPILLKNPSGPSPDQLPFGTLLLRFDRLAVVRPSFCRRRPFQPSESTPVRRMAPPPRSRPSAGADPGKAAISGRSMPSIHLGGGRHPVGPIHRRRAPPPVRLATKEDHSSRRGFRRKRTAQDNRHHRDSPEEPSMRGTESCGTGHSKRLHPAPQGAG